MKTQLFIIMLSLFMTSFALAKQDPPARSRYWKSDAVIRPQIQRALEESEGAAESMKIVNFEIATEDTEAYVAVVETELEICRVSIPTETRKRNAANKLWADKIRQDEKMIARDQQKAQRVVNAQSQRERTIQRIRTCQANQREQVRMSGGNTFGMGYSCGTIEDYDNDVRENELIRQQAEQEHEQQMNEAREGLSGKQHVDSSGLPIAYVLNCSPKSEEQSDATSLQEAVNEAKEDLGSSSGMGTGGGGYGMGMGYPGVGMGEGMYPQVSPKEPTVYRPKPRRPPSEIKRLQRNTGRR
ncbi:MAG: hypothetical protein AB7F59_14945 [Bdellovibrionales bacterium]